VVRVKRRNSPHRFGRQSRINEHPREIGEPSQRAVERESPRLPPTIESRQPGYAELHCLSNFSFQRGASSAQELFLRAKQLGYAALAITDECSLAGIVRALEAAKETGLKLIVGTEVRLEDGVKLIVLATDHSGYSDICRLITTGRRRSAKGEYRLTRADIEQLGSGVRMLWAPGALANADVTRLGDVAKWIMQHFAHRAWLVAELHHGPDDTIELQRLRELGARHAIPLVAAGDVHMHVRRRRALQDVMTAIRLRCTVAEAGHALFPNGERHLRRLVDLQQIYPPELLDETLRIAEQCQFTLDDLNYEYPHEIVPPEFNGDASAYLRHITYLGAAQRLSHGVTPAIRATLEKELALIQRKKFEAFFLTVYEIVKWAREQTPPILCQGRGSSANSAVCFCLGITAVNPEKDHLLFERFLSDERDEPPDIDVDFEHERREEVIQHIFDTYGRDRAAIAATVICYRHKSAVRDVGRALGLSDDALDQLSAISTRIPHKHTRDEALRERGFDPDSRLIKQLVALADELRGFPRHLSQHVGGFVISEQPLHHLVPVENAAMAERTIIQWDKDDLETMKLLKVDVLALGMLTALRKCLDLLHAHGQWRLSYKGDKPSLHDIPQDDDTQVYDMICAADTVGVFQIESRAQMSMLPRLRPERFYDLVVEVAIVRPGPIQGQMVHPYLTRRKNPDAVEYPQSRFERAAQSQDSRVRKVLGRTLGVPIFQEQVMELLRVTADFTPGEADQLRRSMAAWRRRGGLEHFEQRIFEGMDNNGYDREFAQQIFEQIQGFGEYGFPESHATSFALLAWASSWLKHYHPAAFTCALLNSQPMGFYQPAQLIQDAQQHGVRVLPADVTISIWDCTLEPSEQAAALGISHAGGARNPHVPCAYTPVPALRDVQSAFARDASSKVSSSALALRLGLRQIQGFARATAERVVAARAIAPLRNVADLTERARLNTGERASLANAGALRSLSGHRYRARWDSAGAELPLPVLTGSAPREAQVTLRAPSLREDVMTDYATQGLSLTLHPLALIRPALSRRRVVPARATTHTENYGRRLRCAGLVTVRQHPGTAKGVTFVTLEDETGIVNVVVWQRLAEKQHRVLIESAVMAVDGKLEAVDGVHHLIADRLHDYSALLPEFSFASRDFH
jgi:error-prone DNA polymerase